MSEFFIGFDRMPKTPEGDVPAIERPALHLEADTLLRHMMALGSSGSGKAMLPGKNRVMRCQKPSSAATRVSGALPAIIAALMAPIDTPATQSGTMPRAASAW